MYREERLASSATSRRGAGVRADLVQGLAALARRVADRTPAWAEILLALQPKMIGIFQWNSSTRMECSNSNSRALHSNIPPSARLFFPPAAGIQPLDQITRVQALNQDRIEDYMCIKKN